MIGKTLPSARPVFLFAQDSPQTATDESVHSAGGIAVV
jgi:hypothetical protein